MGKGDMRGFTIIEVTIFLTISGLLLTMALIGSGSMARSMRFSDTVNGFQSYLQRQYESVTSGVNTRAVTGSGPANCNNTSLGASNCLLLGRIVSFDTSSSTMTTRYITGGSVAYTGNDYTDIANVALLATTLKLQASDNGKETFDLAWGARVAVASRKSVALASPLNASKTPAPPLPATPRGIINNVAFIRSPNSSEIVSYYFYSEDLTLAKINEGLATAVSSANYTTTSRTQADVCLINDKDYPVSSPKATIEFGRGSGAASIDTNFQPTTGASGVCY